MSPAKARAKIAKIFANRSHPYFFREHPDHAKAVAETRKLFAIAYGEETFTKEPIMFYSDTQLNPEVKKLWTTALRSGHYKQCQGALEIEEVGMCCLGVLSSLAYAKGICTRSLFGPDDSDRDNAPEGILFKYDNHGLSLPHSVSIWAGVPSDDVTFKWDGTETMDRFFSLSQLNDHGFTFNQIADVIDFFL